MAGGDGQVEALLGKVGEGGKPMAMWIGLPWQVTVGTRRDLYHL